MGTEKGSAEDNGAKITCNKFYHVIIFLCFQYFPFNTWFLSLFIQQTLAYGLPFVETKIQTTNMEPSHQGPLRLTVGICIKTNDCNTIIIK